MNLQLLLKTLTQAIDRVAVRKLSLILNFTCEAFIFQITRSQKTIKMCGPKWSEVLVVIQRAETETQGVSYPRGLSG